MLKINILAAATAAALFAVGGAVAQTSTSGSTGAAASTDKAPTARTGPKEAGGTDKSMRSGSSAGSASSGATSGSTTASRTSTAPTFSAIDKNNDGQISRAEWSEYERTARPAAGIRSDKQPTARTGPRDAGGSDKAKNPGPAGAAAGSTGAAAGSTGAAASTDKAPTTSTGPKSAGGTDNSMSSGSSAGSSSSGATTGSTSAGKKDAGAERGYPTAPSGEPRVGGSNTK